MRRFRNEASLSLDQAAEAMGWNGTKMSKIENAIQGIKPGDLAELLKVYGVTDPDVTQLTVVAPGPTVLVKDRKISGQFISQSMRLEKGKSYPFEIVVEARRAGNWHLHPMLAVLGAGGLIGPGQEVHIAENPSGAPFTNDITLATGETVDLETYNSGDSVVWHLLYLIPAVLFLVYWFGKPLMPRLIALTSGRRTPGELVTKRDVKVSVALGLIVFGITAASMVAPARRVNDGLAN